MLVLNVHMNDELRMRKYPLRVQFSPLWLQFVI